jgi:hypothetical protein
MPIQENSQLDDQIAFDGDVSFSGGQASNVRKNTIAEGAYSIGKNTDFDTFGNIVSRKGVAQLVGDVVNSVWGGITTTWNATSTVWTSNFTGSVGSIAYFDTPTVEKIVVAESDTAGATYKIKIVGETGSIADTGGTFSSTADSVYFAQLVGRMYYCDGVGSLGYIDDTSSSQVITVGKITSVEMTDTGSEYASVPTVTFSTSSGSTAAGTAVLGYGGKVQSISITDAGSGYSATVPPTVTISSAPSGGTDAKGVAHLSQTPSKPKLLTSHTNRLFCTSADTAVPSDTLYASDILDGESWDIIGNAIRVGDGTGDPITAIASWYSYNLLVFKERSVWVVEANPAVAVADWSIKLINNRVGCVAHRSVQQVGSDVFFLASDGVRSLSTIESGAQTDVSTPISAPINDQFKQNTDGFQSKSCSAFYDNRYLISVCSDGLQVPNRTYVYNTEQKSWSGFWTGWQPNDFAVTSFGGKTRLQFADQTGKIYTWLNFIELNDESESFYLDQTTPYETELVTRAYNFKEIFAPKAGYQVEFDMDNQLAQDQKVSFFFLKDMDGYESQILQETGFELETEELDDLTQTFLGELASDVVVGNGKRHFIKGFNLLSKGKFEDIQFVIATDSGRLSLHSVKTSAFPDTINPQR